MAAPTPSNPLIGAPVQLVGTRSTGAAAFIQADSEGRLMVAADIVIGDLVNVGINDAEFAGGPGAVDAQTQRVTLASDDPAVVALQIIDDWDESDRAKVNPIVGQAGIAAGAGVVGATVPRVTLGSDDPAVTALQVIDDWDESDRAKVNPIVGQAGIAAGAGVVGVTVPRTTLASDDPAVAALQVIDDWDATEDAAAPSDGVMNMAESRSGDKAAMTTDGDAVRFVADEFGKLASAVLDWAGRFDRVQEQSPPQDHAVGITLADVTNGADGTYSYYWDCDTYPLWVLQGDLDGGSGTVTVTFEASAQDTAQGSAFYTDETLEDFGVASATADFCWKCDTPTAYKWGKAKVVANTTGADDADWALYLRELY